MLNDETLLLKMTKALAAKLKLNNIRPIRLASNGQKHKKI